MFIKTIAISLFLFSCAVFSVEDTRFPNGDIFFGKVENGYKQGGGGLLKPNGDLISGNWSNDYCSGFMFVFKKSGEQFYSYCQNGNLGEEVRIATDMPNRKKVNPNPGKWFLWGVGDDGLEFYDPKSLKKSNSIVTAWDLSDLGEPKQTIGGSYLSTITKLQFDCPNENVRAISTYWYSMRQGKGSIVRQMNHEFEKNTDSRWNPIPPTSDLYKFMTNVCKR